MKILSMKTTIFLGAMLSLLVCLMFTGCSNSETNSTSRGLTDFAHIEEEYLATIDSLNWPDGITLPDKLEDEDTGASFQVGYGETRASYLWEYSWMKEWLDTYNTDPERAEKALEELEKAFDMPYMGIDRCDDATRNYLRENIDKAKLGDPSGFTESIRANYANQIYYDNDLVVAKPDGAPIAASGVSSQFGKLLEDLDMPHIRFHDLRHTAATNMHQLTGDFYTVGEVLGHTLAGIGASLGLSMNFEAVTARYVDVRLERKKEVLDAYHSAVEKAAPEKPKEAEPKKGKRAAKKKHSEIDL